MKGVPIFAHLVAVMIASIAFILEAMFQPENPTISHVGLMILGYGLSGNFLGLVWPAGSWRWGVWVAAPILILTGLGFMFTGPENLPLFLHRAGALVLACFGGLLGSRLSSQRLLRGRVFFE